MLLATFILVFQRSTGSQRGFYSFVDDPVSPEAEMNEAWMVSPERQAKLATLKEESSFKLQTYASGKKPGSLFEEDEDSRYQVNTNGAQLKTEEEEKQLRQEIIHSQAPKKIPTFREQWSALETLDLSKSPNKLLDGFSLCYGPSSINSESTPAAEPCTIDNEQINFSAAREQFLKMEQSRLNPFLQSPSSLKPQRRLWRSEDSLLSPRSEKKDYHSAKWFNQSLTPVKRQDKWENVAGRKVTSNDNPQPESKGTQSVSGYRETPIEREIRIAQEREESLRRLRGIKHTDVQEMVEVKSLLSQPTPPLLPVKANKKNRVSFFIQREIKKDSQREEDLLHQGRVPGLYDWGTPQELEDRRKIFELRDQSGAEVETMKRACEIVNYPSWLVERKKPVPVRGSSTKEASSSSSSPTPTTFAVQVSELSDEPIPTWRAHLDSGGLRPRRPNAPDIIQKEIEQDLKREQELRELRESSGLSASMEGNLDCIERNTEDAFQSQSLRRVIVEQEESVFSESPSLPVEQTSLARWSYSSITPVSMLGRMYAGIQPTDDVNNEVLEATRVTRHKNKRALRWEAGDYTKEDSQ
uniref:Mitotic interactor and substrate of PLK1-like n=1 Tax=Salmo trutta TaxID=8032 RepID=A0A673WSG9_SALTR